MDIAPTKPNRRSLRAKALGPSAAVLLLIVGSMLVCWVVDRAALPVGLILTLLILLFILLRRIDRTILAQQAQLRESEERQAATLQSIGDGVISTDMEGRITGLNAMAERLTGWNAAEAVARPITEIFHIIHAGTREPAENPVEPALREGRGVELAKDTLLVNRDGQERPIADSCAPIRNADGTTIGAVLVFRDVSEEHRAKTALWNRVKELTCLQQIRDAVHGNVSTEQACGRIVSYLASAMRFPEIAVAVISFGEQRFVGDGWEDCPVRGIHAGIKTTGDLSGRLSVFYKQDRPFLSEEQDLVNASAVILGHFLDRKRSEEELRASQSRLRGITDSAQDAILMMDPNGTISFWNPAAEAILGYRADEAIGRDLHNLLTPDRFLAAHRAAFPEFLRTGRGNAVGKTVELVARRKDGREIAVALSLSALWINDAWHAVGILRDISERKRAELELTESKQRLDIALDGAQMGDWYWDIPEDRRYYSGRTYELLGINSRCFQGTADEFFAAMLPEDREAVKAALRRTLEEDVPYETEYRVVRGDGVVRHITARGKLFRDDAGRPLKLCGVVWDVSDQKQSENDLRYTVAALESANKAMEEFSRATESATRAKSEFLANMSHEIRTPMTAILGFAEVLLGEEGLDRAPPERVEVIRTIQRNASYLLQLINDILDLSKIEAGKMEVELVACSPLHVLSEVVSLMRIRAEAKNLPLLLEYVGAIPESIQCDPLRLRQVLINLVGNAIKFTETGCVRVVTRLIRRLGKSAMLQFDVIDTGIGLSQEQISKLFRPFSQANSSTTRKFGGTGLGLAISKRLVEKLGGDITVSSEPGEGCTFSVTVETGDLEGVRLLEPSVPSALPAAPTSSDSAAAIQLDCRILLAEDGPDNQRLLSFLLKKAGGEVTLVENGQSAVDSALAAREAGQPFDVILMDMQMPVMDGYEATQRLRDLGYTGPIVALTAHAMAEDRQKCLAAGCNDYATKPVDRQQLLAVIAHWANEAARSRPQGHNAPETLAKSDAGEAHDY